jgi:hypothetical protein
MLSMVRNVRSYKLLGFDWDAEGGQLGSRLCWDDPFLPQRNELVRNRIGTFPRFSVVEEPE